MAELNVQQLKAEGNGQLTSTLDYQLVLIKKVITELHTTHISNIALHVEEEEIVRLENRVLEELLAIQLAKHHTSSSHTAEVLVQQANELIKRSQAAFKSVPSHDRDYEAAVHEVKVLEAFIKSLDGVTQSDVLLKAELQLVKHEQTLNVLLERLKIHSL